MVPDIAVDTRRIGPVGLDRDDGEAVLLDQSTGDRRSGPVELGRAVGRLAEEYDIGIAEAVEEGAKLLRSLRRRQRFKMRPQRLGQLVGFLSFPNFGVGYDAHLGHRRLRKMDHQFSGWPEIISTQGYGCTD